MAPSTNYFIISLLFIISVHNRRCPCVYYSSLIDFIICLTSSSANVKPTQQQFISTLSVEYILNPSLRYTNVTLHFRRLGLIYGCYTVKYSLRYLHLVRLRYAVQISLNFIMHHHFCKSYKFYQLTIISTMPVDWKLTHFEGHSKDTTSVTQHIV
jgi:hypothetical protein